MHNHSMPSDVVMPILHYRAQLLLGDGAFVVATEDREDRWRGARIDLHPTTYPFGERQYIARDIVGHEWTFSESVRDVDPAEWGGLLLLHQ